MNSGPHGRRHNPGLNAGFTARRLKSSEVPDPRKLDQEELEQIERAFDDLLERERELDHPGPEDKEEQRDALNRAVLSTVGLEGRLDELKQAVGGLVESREMAAGQYTEVLVERLQREAEDTGSIELPDVAEARESTTIDEF